MTVSFDPEKARAALSRSVVDVFTDMSFIDVIPLDAGGFDGGRADPATAAGDEAEGSGQVHAIIDVLKPMSCRIELRLRQSLRSRISGILFDGAPEEEDKERDDSILEMLNVIAGAFITAYFGKGSEVKLELPRYLYFREADEGDTVAAIGFDAEGEAFRAILSSIRYRY